MNKEQVRDNYCTLRECLPAEEVTNASAAVCRRLANMDVLQEAQTVLAYLAFRNEVDLDLLFELLPDIDWVVPRIEGKRLIIHPYDPDNLIPHEWGILEPPVNAPEVEPTNLDVVLVPGVSFDRRGGRLGFGGGFYDRFLVKTPAVRIGVTYDDCLAENLPCAEHDQRMDWVVTPTQTLHCAPIWKTECEPR